MTKTEQAWQRVKDAHDTMMQAYQEYLDIAQEEGVLPKIGHVYHQKTGYVHVGKDILVNSFEKSNTMPNRIPYIIFSPLKKDGTKSAITASRSSFQFTNDLIYKGEYSNDKK